MTPLFEPFLIVLSACAAVAIGPTVIVDVDVNDEVYAREAPMTDTDVGELVGRQPGAR